MRLHLETSLANHRHGRFFVAQLAAEASDGSPDEGMLLMHGKVFQAAPDEQQENLWRWTGRPGCVLLLLPPFLPGDLCEHLDWRVSMREHAHGGNEKTLAALLSEEVLHTIDGDDGGFEADQGHQWSDYSFNTRYFKQHQGCGVFAATTLPLWSISLLDEAKATRSWLAALLALAGKAAAESPEIDSEVVELQPTDYTLMLCMHVFAVSSAEAIMAALADAPVSLIRLRDEAVIEGTARLTGMGLVAQQGLSEAGEQRLMASPYGVYAERMREELQP